MNTQEFMDRSGLSNRSSISRYIKLGVIEPVKRGKVYDYSESDLEKIAQHLHPEKAQKFEGDRVNILDAKFADYIKNTLNPKFSEMQQEIDRLKGIIDRLQYTQKNFGTSQPVAIESVVLDNKQEVELNLSWNE